MLIENDIDDIFVCRLALQRANINVDLHVVHSMDVAINWLEGNAPFQNRALYPVPDLLVSDFRMPEQSGLELLRWARESEKFRNLPIVIHSGSFAPGQAADCMNAGATAAIEKEPLCQHLVETIIVALGLGAAC